MSLSLPNPVPRDLSSAERRWGEAERRWEAQLGKQAAHGRAMSEAAAIIRSAPARSFLQLISTATPRDALLLPRILPAFTGNEQEELLCGKCYEVIGVGVSAHSVRRRHPEGRRLMIRCLCGGLNLLARSKALRQ